MVAPAVDDVSPPITLRHVVFLTRGSHPKSAPRPALVVLPQVNNQLGLLVVNSHDGASRRGDTLSQ